MVGLSEYGQKKHKNAIFSLGPQRNILKFTYSEPARQDDFGKVGHLNGPFFLSWDPFRHHVHLLVWISCSPKPQILCRCIRDIIYTTFQNYKAVPLSFHQRSCLILKIEMGLFLTRGGYKQKVSSFSPNSFVMVKYKTFHLKHHIVFVKICPPTGQITFWISPL